MHLDGLNCFEVHFSHEHPLQLFINLILHLFYTCFAVVIYSGLCHLEHHSWCTHMRDTTKTYRHVADDANVLFLSAYAKG